MNSLSPLVAWLLVIGIVGAATFLAVQQFRARASLPFELSSDDAAYFRAQFVRRLVGCVLLLIIAAMIAGAYVSGLEARAEQIGDVLRADAGGDRQPTPEQKQFQSLYAGYWIGVLLLLLAVVIVAALDLYAIRRYGSRHLKQIRDDRRAMIEREIANYRRERGRRNGVGESEN